MDLELPLWFEIGSLVVLTLILVGDLLLILKRPHIPSTRESTLWVVFYVMLALIFAGLMWIFAGPEYAGQFVAGWLTEYSLSIDNLFVFVLIMSQFAVPRRYQQEVLMVGIIIALILRGAFILVGAAVIEQFSWVFYIFGAFLVWTAWRQAFPGGDHDEDVQARELHRADAAPHDRHQRPLRRREAAHRRRRQEDLHADGHRLRRDRRHRPAVRDRLDPGDLRHHDRARSSCSPRTSSP